MGQKINPIAYRLGVNIDWPSRWAASKKKQYQEFLLEDAKIRRFLEKRLSSAGLIAVNIERSFNKMKLTLQTSRPGVVIGRGGKSLEALKKELCQIVSIEEPEKNLEIRIEEVEKPELSALFVAQKIADQLKRRLPYRQVVQKEMERVREAGAQGIKVRLAGRIGGANIARQEKFSQGKVPTSTIRANIDYAEFPALTGKGYVGVKVWINR